MGRLRSAGVTAVEEKSLVEEVAAAFVTHARGATWMFCLAALLLATMPG